MSAGVGVSSECLTREGFISKLKQVVGRIYFLKAIGVRASFLVGWRLETLQDAS